MIAVPDGWFSITHLVRIKTRDEIAADTHDAGLGPMTASAFSDCSNRFHLFSPPKLTRDLQVTNAQRKVIMD